MKKIIFICAIILFSTISTKLSTTAQEKDAQWLKLNNYIYIDESSITKTIDGASARFKIYDSPKNKLYEINDTNIYYQINKYEIGCKDPKTISIAHSKSYDKNDNLLDEYINEQGYACTYPCMVNDDIFVKELCK